MYAASRSNRQSKGEALEGREVDGLALDEVRRCLRVSQHPDLLIEHLHKMRISLDICRLRTSLRSRMEMRLATPRSSRSPASITHLMWWKEGETAPPA